MFADDSATNNSNQDEDKRVPTFCLIKGIPAHINFDDKSLRIALKKQTTGLKKCLMIPPSSDAAQEEEQQEKDEIINFSKQEVAKTYAIAQFESKEAALDAAEPNKVQLVLDDDRNNSNSSVFLTIVPIQPDKAIAHEAFYKDTIKIDGEEVLKSDLADTTGLASALKSFSGFREQLVTLEKGPGGIVQWCKSTKKKEDCPYGNQCWSIHLKKYQKTITPKVLGGAAASNQQQHHETSRRGREDNEEADHQNNNSVLVTNVVVPKLACESMKKIPSQFRLNGGRTIQVEPSLIEKVFLTATSQPEEEKVLEEKIQHAMDEMIATNNDKKKTLFFVKFDIPHGSPSDLIFSSENNNNNDTKLYEGTESTPNAIKRDVLMHSAWRFHHKQNLSVSTAKEALDLSKKSPKVRGALRKFMTKIISSSSSSSFTTVPIRIDFFEESLWCPASQYSMLVRTNVGRKQGNHQFIGAAQRVSWILVDIANRRFENPPNVVAQQQLVTEQLGASNDWRRISTESLREVLNDQILSGTTASTSEEMNFLSSTNNNNASPSSSFFCVNVAVPGKLNSELAPRDVELDASSISRPKILSIHDADEAIGQSSLLPFCVKNKNNISNNNNNASSGAQQPKITWRVRTPFPDQVPTELQKILVEYGRNK